MHAIGLLYNPQSEQSLLLAQETKAWFLQQGLNVWCGTSEEARDNPSAMQELDLLVALGGDGTVLRAARIAIPLGIPLLTVALGRLNFMAELGPTELPAALKKLREGDGWYEQRSLLQAGLYRRGELIEEFLALNEVVLSRGDVGRTLTVDVQVDDIPLTTYRADGVIVATATGSTAYALSAGGPIVDPRSKSLLLVSVAAHLTAVPSMVLHEDSVVTLNAHCHHHAALSVDGREDMSIIENDVVKIQRSTLVCTFARVQPPTHFYASFVKRLRRE